MSASDVDRLAELLAQVAAVNTAPDWACSIMARLDTLEASTRARLVRLLAKVDLLVEAEPPSKTKGRTPGKPPAALWCWIVNELCQECGPQMVAVECGVAVADVLRWQHGETPTAGQRDDLRTLLASVWGRELFVDADEMEQMRDRVMGRPNGAHT